MIWQKVMMLPTARTTIQSFINKSPDWPYRLGEITTCIVLTALFR